MPSLEASWKEVFTTKELLGVKPQNKPGLNGQQKFKKG